MFSLSGQTKIWSWELVGSPVIIDSLTKSTSMVELVQLRCWIFQNRKAFCKLSDPFKSTYSAGFEVHIKYPLKYNKSYFPTNQTSMSSVKKNNRRIIGRINKYVNRKLGFSILLDHSAVLIFESPYCFSIFLNLILIDFYQNSLFV